VSMAQDLAGAGREPAGDELDERVTGVFLARRRAVRLLIIAFLVSPVAVLLSRHGMTGKAAFLVPATAVFVVAVDRVALAHVPPRASRPHWMAAGLAALAVLAAALLAVGGINWLSALAVAAAAMGRFAARPRLALAGVACCGVAGFGVGLVGHFGYGDSITAGVVPLLAGMLAHSAERRNVLIRRLQQTRAELARAAVAQERLRISRDLHDLLGHSLSLIALKAELAGRLIGTDAARAAREISELETVARQSLTEVRQAVTSYRQPSLAAELAAAARMLASAGIDCRTSAPDGYSLPPAVDALLAWTVREGATNVVRHSGARRAGITIDITGTAACAELTDDGRAPRPAGGGTGAPTPLGQDAPGAGLAGLAERAGRLGGTLSAGTAERGGFRLLVSVPLDGTQAESGPQTTSAAAGPGPGGRGQLTPPGRARGARKAVRS
jgi:two-component system, NarL family, sensor histidine kinase DesK